MEAFQGLAGLEVREVAGRGRCLVTARRFRAGEELLRQYPYVAVDDEATPSCNNCGLLDDSGPGPSFKRCSACKTVKYCSAACQKKSWKVHALECKVWSGCQKEGHHPTPTMRLLLRLLLRKRAAQATGAPSTEDRQVAELIMHRGELPQDRLVSYSQMAAAIAAALRDHLDGFSAAGAAAGRSAEEAHGAAVDELVELMCCLACNAHTICDGELRPTGKGLFPVVAMVNHSCLPNCALMFEGSEGVLRALVPMEAGEEATISYVDVAAVTASRRRDLQDGYFFHCTCPRCQSAEAGDAATLAMEGVRCTSCGGAVGPVGAEEGAPWKCGGCGAEDAGAATRAAGVDQMVEDGKNLRRGGSARAALATLEQAAAEARRVCLPEGIRLLVARDELLRARIDLDDFPGAMEMARLTLDGYEAVHGSSSPLVGLQYALAGKIEWHQGNAEEAVRCLRGSLARLEVSHGPHHPLLTQDLGPLLAQAEAQRRGH